MLVSTGKLYVLGCRRWVIPDDKTGEVKTYYTVYGGQPMSLQEGDVGAGFEAVKYSADSSEVIRQLAAHPLPCEVQIEAMTKQSGRNLKVIITKVFPPAVAKAA